MNQKMSIKIKKTPNLFILFFLILLLVQFFIFKIFTINNIFANWIDILLRRHIVGESYIPPPPVNFIFPIYNRMSSISSILPDFITSRLWSPLFVYIFLSIPVTLAIALLLSLLRNRKVRILLCMLFLIIFLPIIFIFRHAVDGLIVSTHFNIQTPFSPKYVWIWNSKDSGIPYTKFSYFWKQKQNPSRAFVNVSCLGHYQMFVNQQLVSRGPMFAIMPNVYFDSVNITSFTHKGENTIDIICNFIKEPVHEYFQYDSPGLLIGGTIKDGFFNYTLSDSRLWQSTGLYNFQNGLRIGDAGFAEIIDFSQTNGTPVASTRLPNVKYKPLPRPIPNLASDIEVPLKISENLYDLGSFQTGYLNIQSDFKTSCKMNLTWNATRYQTGPYYDQQDKIIFPAGKFQWQQFSRRSGRFITINQNCGPEFNLTFQREHFPFAENLPPEFLTPIDKQIYQISLNTLRNNVQNHPEDSVEREKAMYLGDLLSDSECLLTNVTNAGYIKEMILQFAQSQNDDGSFPSMTPSGTKQLIPGYSLQWIPLLHLYLSKTNDRGFAELMYPHVQKVLNWANQNISEEGFFYNKHQNPIWWMFTDWTPTFDNRKYPTSLQLWYMESLKDAYDISKIIDRPDMQLVEQYDSLRKKLFQYGFNYQTHIFADSFDLNSKSGSSLVVNGLAGMLLDFPDEDQSQKGILFFSRDFTTSSPYSETWVIQWMINLGEKDLALQTLRDYWGAMVMQGSTSVPEAFKPNWPKVILSSLSYSHSWGCGPYFLYTEIVNK